MALTIFPVLWLTIKCTTESDEEKKPIFNVCASQISLINFLCIGKMEELTLHQKVVNSFLIIHVFDISIKTMYTYLS